MGRRLDRAGAPALTPTIFPSGMQRTPVVLVVGDSEVENRTVTVNRRGSDDMPSVSVDALVEELALEVAERRLSDHVVAALAGSTTD